MSATSRELTSLLPHQPPMRLLERLLEHTDKSVLTQARLQSGGPFDVGGSGDACACLELIAQAAAVVAALQREGEPVEGMVASCRELLLHAPVPLDQPLHVRAEHTAGDLDFASFRGEVRHGEQLLAEANLTVVLAQPSGALYSSEVGA